MMTTLLLPVAVLALLSLGAVHANLGNANPPTGTCLCVSGSRVRVRAGAGLSHRMTGSANTGECYKFAGSRVTANGYRWFRVNYGRAPGWIVGNYLSTNLKLSDARARGIFRSRGISVVSSRRCSDRYNRRCTSLEQVRANSVSGMVRLRAESGCPITVTGGTEVGHASGARSHWNGWKLDTSLGACVTNYIRRRYSYAGRRGDGAVMYRDGHGNLFSKERNHWDIRFVC